MKGLVLVGLVFCLLFSVVTLGKAYDGSYDIDNDGVEDSDDLCPNTVLPGNFKRLIVWHYGDVDGDNVFETRKRPLEPVVNSEWTLEDTYGCSCEQILEFKPGTNAGEILFGCTEATIKTFISRIGWSKDLLPLSWWNHNWPYRQPINVSVSSGTTEQGYQVKLLIDSVNSGTGWNWTSECLNENTTRARFASGSGETDLDFWVESCSVTEKFMKVWVKIDQNITTSNYTIYMYYGNYEAYAASDGSATFDLFEDCEDNDVSDWEADGLSTVECSAEAKRFGNYGMLFTGNDDTDWTNYRIVYKTFAPQMPGLRKIYLWWYDPETGHAMGDDDKYIFIADGPTLYQPGGTTWNQMGWSFRTYDDKIKWWSEKYIDTYVPQHWYKTDILLDMSKPNMYIDMDDGAMTKTVTPGDVWTKLDTIMVHIEKHHEEPTTFYMDNLFMTKHHDPEPTRTFGEEEIHNSL